MQIVDGILGRDRPDPAQRVFHPDWSLEKCVTRVYSCQIGLDFEDGTVNLLGIRARKELTSTNTQQREAYYILAIA